MIKVFDLFAGAGGFGLGFQLAGFDLCLSLEIDLWATDTLRINNSNNTIIINDDIRKFQTKTQILQSCQNVIPDVIIGGPPCQGFSIAGPKKDPKDPRNSLFIDFARWVQILYPKVFIIENVKGIISRHNSMGEKVIDIIKSNFMELGYSAEIWLLNAAEYGVPQYRERVFIVGNLYHDNIGIPPKTHKLSSNTNANELKNAITVDEAINDLPLINAGEGSAEMPYSNFSISEYQKWARGEQNILYNHEAMKHTQRIIWRFEQIKWGESVSDVPERYGAKKRNGNGIFSESNYNMNNRRLDPNKPSYTIPAFFYSSFIHPYQHRNITAREAARLQSFPDFYRFMGKRTIISSKLLQRQEKHDDNHLSQYNQIGNAVPPLLAKIIADHILEYLSRKYNDY